MAAASMIAGGSTKKAKLTPKRQTVRRKTVRNQKGDAFFIPEADPQYGGLVSGEPVIFETNLPKPRQHLAFRAREFLAIDILGETKGIMAMPWNLDVELSGAQNASDQKFVEARFALNPSADMADMVVGETPVRTQIALRKGSNPGNDNRSILRLTFSEFERLLTVGRDLVRALSYIEGQSFGSHEEIHLPQEEIIRTRAPEMRNGQLTFVLLSVSLVKFKESDNIVRPMISIREYIEDKRNDVHVATAKGVALGAKAFYNLVYPTALAIRKLHDAYAQMKVFMDDFIKISNDRMTRLANLPAWDDGTDPLADDLAMDEKLVKITETALDDNQQDEDGFDNVSIADETQNFDLDDALTVAAE